MKTVMLWIYDKVISQTFTLPGLGWQIPGWVVVLVVLLILAKVLL